VIRADVRHRDLGLAEAGRVDVDDRDRRQAERAVGVPEARHHEHSIGLLDGRDVGLLAVQQIPVAVLAHVRRQVVRVRAGVGLGDRERDLGGARTDAAQPAVLLLGRTVLGEDAADDRRRHDDQQQRGARGRDLLADLRQRFHPEAPSAVLLRDVHPQVAAARQRVPELRRGLIGRDLLVHVLLPEVGADAGHGFAEEYFLLVRDEIESGG
jgi:hypothetical protein